MTCQRLRSLTLQPLRSYTTRYINQSLKFFYPVKFSYAFYFLFLAFHLRAFSFYPTLEIIAIALRLRSWLHSTASWYQSLTFYNYPHVRRLPRLLFPQISPLVMSPVYFSPLTRQIILRILWYSSLPPSVLCLFFLKRLTFVTLPAQDVCWESYGNDWLEF